MVHAYVKLAAAMLWYRKCDIAMQLLKCSEWFSVYDMIY